MIELIQRFLLLYQIFYLTIQIWNHIKKDMMRSNVKPQFGKSSQIFLNESDSPKHLELPCRYHPGSICLNYCHEFQCFRLLCEECIEQHLEYHKKTSLSTESIKSLKKVRQFCINKLNILLEELCLNMNNLKQPKNPQQIIEDANFKFQKVKNIMFEIIQSQLNRFQEQLRNKVNQSFSTIKNLEDIHANLEKIIRQLNQSKVVVIQGTRQMPQVVQKVLAMDDQVYRESFSREVDVYSQKLAMIQFDISINQGAFRNSVNQCLKINKNQYNKPEYDDMAVGKSKVQVNEMRDNSRISQFNLEQKFLNLNPTIQSPISLLHFFETCEPRLHLFDLSMMGKSSAPRHSVIELSSHNNPYFVPDFHASILSQLGYIFISGGIIRDEEDSQQDRSIKSNIMSKFSLKQNKFKQQFCKVIPRSSHSLVQADGFIYIMGGYGHSNGGGVEIEYAFQQVNIRSGQVKNLPRSNSGGANLSAVIYPYILKASEQQIQIYSLPNNSWSSIRNHNSPYSFLRECGYSKISSEQLLIYGGYGLRDQLGVDTCSVWQIDNAKNLSPDLMMNNSSIINVSAKELKQIRLPDKGGFWNNPGIVVNGSLYVLQNIEDSDGEIIEDQRNLLKFNGEKWVKIKY